MHEAKELGPVDVAIIGAGMAGLSAAVYAGLSGLTARVFEKHSIPGGLCTSWKRSGYVFDYCIDYFVGNREGQGFYDEWKDIGVIGNTEFAHIDSFGRYEGADGRILDLFTDPDRLRPHLLSISPEDAKKINELCEGIRKAGGFMLGDFTPSLENLPAFLRSLPAFPTMLRWAGVSVGEWCSGLKSAFLREGLIALIGSGDITLSGPMMMFGLMNRGYAAYPMGASLPLAMAAEARAKSLGAEFAYRCGARRLVLEDGQARGIELEDGRVQLARAIVSACDARWTFDSLLGGIVKDPTYEAMFEEREIYGGIVQLSLGFEPDPAWGLADAPKRMVFPVGSTLIVDGREQTMISIYQYSADPGMAPPGRTVLVARFEADYDRWKRLLADPAAYQAEKKRILADTVRALEARFPGMKTRIEASDVSTPTSCERYTGNWRGSTQGWLMTPERMKKMMAGKRLPRSFPEVPGLYLAGQWTEPGGGLPPCVKTGREAIRAILKAKAKLEKE